MDKPEDLIISPFPIGEEASKDYSVTVNGKPIFVYKARVSAFPLNQIWPGYQRPLEQTELASFAYWDMSSSVIVEITPKIQVKTISIKPSSFGIKHEVQDNRITFVMSCPNHITVEINGTHHALHLFPNHIEEKTVAKDDTKVRYFGPGVHKIGKIKLNSGETVFIDAGAVVYGAIEAKEASNIKILGRGILDTSEFKRCSEEEVNGCISLIKCSNIEIDGIILRDPNAWTVTLSVCCNVNISNIKLIGLWRYNADGIDIVNSQNVKVERCFVRSFDDSIVVKGMKNWELEITYDTDVHDIEVNGCVLWCDWGRAIEIGAETCADNMSDIIFRNCNIIRTTHIALDIQHGDHAVIKNIRFENINVETDDFNPRPVFQSYKEEKYIYRDNDDYCPLFVFIGIEGNIWSQDNERGSARDVYAKNISVTGKHFPESIIFGFDDFHKVENVTFENININGKAIKNAEEGCFKIGDFTDNIKFSI